MLKLFIKLSALSLGLSYATSNCQKVQESHMAALHERMNEMINALYSSSLLSKIKPSSLTSTPEASEPANQPTYSLAAYPTPSATPQVIYVAAPPVFTPASSNPSPLYLSPGVQPVDYTYPVQSNPHPRSAHPPPTYSYEYSYPPYPVQPYYPPPPYPCEYGYSYPEHAPAYNRPPYSPPSASPPPPYQPPAPFHHPPYYAHGPYSMPTPASPYPPPHYPNPEVPPRPYA